MSTRRINRAVTGKAATANPAGMPAATLILGLLLLPCP